jgi:uncharacterized protein YbcI
MPDQFDSPRSPVDAPGTTHTSVVADISREIVKTHSQYYGRGPTKARTIWKDDLIVVVLEEIFTRAERTLVEAGHFEQVRATRQAFQDEVEPLFRQLVEQATGRKVRSFLSQVNFDGIASEVFVLARQDAGRGELDGLGDAPVLPD